MRFRTGSVIVAREDWRGYLHSASPCLVVADDGQSLIEWMPVGTRSIYATSRLVPGREHLPRNERKLVTMETCQWLYTSVVAETAGLSFVDDQHWSRISLGWSRDRTFLGWYVNFQRPLLRTEIGYDSMDLVVDLVVEPDSRTWRWKDQADFERAIKRHIIEDELRESVQEEADRVLEMASRAAGPFAS